MSKIFSLDSSERDKIMNLTHIAENAPCNSLISNIRLFEV